MKTLITITILAVLTGCAGVYEPVKVEKATVPNQTLPQVKASSISYLASQGWAPKSSDGTILTFEKPASGAAQFLYNQPGYQNARDRFTLTLLESPSGVEMIGHVVVVYMQHGNPQESHTDQTNAKARYLVSCVRASVLGEPIPEPPTKTNTLNKPVSTRGASH